MEEETITIELPLTALNGLSLQSIGYLASVLALSSKAGSQLEAAKLVGVIHGDLACQGCEWELLNTKVDGTDEYYMTIGYDDE